MTAPVVTRGARLLLGIERTEWSGQRLNDADLFRAETAKIRGQLWSRLAEVAR